MAAVNQLGEKLSSFIEDKESVRAEGSVDKYIIVLTLPLARVLTNSCNFEKKHGGACNRREMLWKGRDYPP